LKVIILKDLYELMEKVIDRCRTPATWSSRCAEELLNHPFSRP